jgi:hypothetical protein
MNYQTLINYIKFNGLSIYKQKIYIYKYFLYFFKFKTRVLNNIRLDSNLRSEQTPQYPGQRVLKSTRMPWVIKRAYTGGTKVGANRRPGTLLVRWKIKFVQ